jgi:hypothetical protein
VWRRIDSGGKTGATVVAVVVEYGQFCLEGCIFDDIFMSNSRGMGLGLGDVEGGFSKLPYDTWGWISIFHPFFYTHTKLRAVVVISCRFLDVLFRASMI